MKLLLIDDDKAFLQLMERRLSRDGHRVATAASPEAGLAHLREFQPDLMLVDLGLPGVSGDSFIERLKRDHADVPFAIVTGLHDVEKAVEMMRRGALDYMVKDSEFFNRLTASLARIEQHLTRAWALDASERLRKSTEQRYQALLQAARDGVLEFDAAGQITMANPAAVQMIGSGDANPVGRNIGRFLPEILARIPRLESTAEPADASMLVTVVREDGSTFPANASISMAMIGSERRIAVFIRDISEWRKLEEAVLNVSERERLHFGQEIHDGMGQQLAALAMMSQVLASGAASRDPGLAAQAVRIANGADEALRAARQLARGLAPLGIAEQGLARALQHLAAQISGTTGITCTSSCDPGIDVTNPPCALHLYRIAQEAANNALRHGQATRIHFSLASNEGGFELRIDDNGTGLREGKSNPDGLGLRTMRHRAQSLGGRLLLDSRNSNGTSVRCWVPASCNEASAAKISGKDG
jgi:PAS domain S-box-containing protein